jgi:hypothetical protein
MFEAFIMGVGGFALVWCVWRVCDAGAGGWDLRSDEARQFDRKRKWGINPRAMRWIIPAVVVGIYAYGFYLKYLGLI